MTNIIFSDLLILLVPLWSANLGLNLLGLLTRNYNLKDFPLDFKLNFIDKQRLLGNSKTWLGIPTAIFFGSLGYFILTGQINLLPGVATYTGTVLSGFLKRRLKIQESKALPLIDQTDYLIGALLIYSLSEFKIKPEIWIYATLITIPIHYWVNIFAFKAKLRKYPY